VAPLGAGGGGPGAPPLRHAHHLCVPQDCGAKGIEGGSGPDAPGGLLLGAEEQEALLQPASRSGVD